MCGHMFVLNVPSVVGIKKNPEHTGEELKGTYSLNLHMALVCFPLNDVCFICSVSPNLISFQPKSHPVYAGKKGLQVHSE